MAANNTCGTILLGIDQDTSTSTVIKSPGKVSTGYTFPGPVYFRWKDLGAPLTGE